MQLIHLEAGGKSARLQFLPLPDGQPALEVVHRTASGPVQSFRVASGVVVRRPGQSTPDFQMLLAGDPELQLGGAGRIYERDDLTTAWFDPNAEVPRPVGDFREIDVLHDPTGAEKERRPRVTRRSNLNELLPVKAGKRLPLAEALTQFVFRQTYQIVHTDSLSYEFLHGLAKELHSRQEMAVAGAGAKGNLPLVVRDKGSPFRAFLYGELAPEPDRYKLLLLLSDMELKRPEGRAPKAE
ncbi:MAG: hypothetical protein JSR82_00725 [Verrucomicrobia bacterium]|nr:hypothetical protein [Verrucomicrobiota bacterium]